MPQELTEEDVFNNDVDPLDGLRELRKQEGEGLEAEIEDETGTNAAEILEDKAADELPDDTSEDSSDSETEEETADVEDESTEEPADESATESESEASDEETTGSADDPATEESTGPVTTKVKAGGQEYEFTQEEMLEQFPTIFGQAVDYTRKTQQLAPYRKMVSALESGGVTQEQLNVAIDALKGEKGAVLELLKINNIEPFDLADNDEGKEYTPTEHGKNDYQLELDEITDAISTDEEYPVTVDIIGNQWDQDSRKAFADNPAMIQALHNDVKSGLYDKVAPIAMKMKVLDGNKKSSIEYYMLAGQKVQEATTEQADKPSVADLNKKTQDAESKFDQQSSEARKKRAAGSTKARADRKGVVDYLDDNDEDFDAWYADLQARN